jgi:hypothetical protein
VGWDAVFTTVPWLILSGLGIAIVASYLSLLRYLRV